MPLYNLDTYQILTITAIIVPSLVAIWIIFLQRDLTDKSIKFKNNLKSYEKKEAEKLLQEIQATIKDEKEEALKIIIDYSEEWKLKSEAVSQLINKENDIYRIGKYIIYLLFIIFFSGLYASAGPNEFFLGFNATRLGTFQLFFAAEIFLILWWFLKIFDFARILNKIQPGDIKDIEELINDTTEKIKKSRDEQ
jgi:hypothetical protein